MTLLDVTVIAAYLLAVVAVNRYWAGRVDFSAWLTSKNSIGLGFLVFTVVSTNVGAGTIVGTAGATMHSGIGLGVTYGVGVMIGFAVMAAISARVRSIAPSGDRSSFSEFFRRRYSRSVAIAVGAAIAFLPLLSRRAVQGARRHSRSMGRVGCQTSRRRRRPARHLDDRGCGNRSDMYTDVLHFWAMVLTIVAGVAVEVYRTGGFDGIVSALEAQGRWQTLHEPIHVRWTGLRVARHWHRCTAGSAGNGELAAGGRGR